MRFMGSMDRLPQVFDWVEGELQKKNLSSRDLRDLHLAIEEIVVNVIQHGYRNQEGEIDILLDMSDLNQITVQICDWAPPFNPLAQSIELNTNWTEKDRPEGGLGIFFVKKLMDDIFYQRKENSNQVTLVKKIAHSKHV